MALLALVVGVCEEPQENQGPVDPWVNLIYKSIGCVSLKIKADIIPQVTLESRVRLDPEDFLAYLAFQDPQDQLASKETGDSLATLARQVWVKRDLRVQRDQMDHLDLLELVSQDFKASEDLLGKLVRK